MNRSIIVSLCLCVLLSTTSVADAQVRDPIARKTNPELGFFEPKKSTTTQGSSKNVRSSQSSKGKWFFKKLFR